jgi:hypothetical protein
MWHHPENRWSTPKISVVQQAADFANHSNAERLAQRWALRSLLLICFLSGLRKRYGAAEVMLCMLVVVFSFYPIAG